MTGVAEKPFEERTRLRDTPLQRQVINQPEGADREGSLASGQPIVGELAIHKAAFVGQPLYDPING